MRGKYGIRVYGETYLAFSTKEMLEWITLFREHDAGSKGDAFGAATTMRVFRYESHYSPPLENDIVTITAKRVFTRSRPARATEEAKS